VLPLFGQLVSDQSRIHCKWNEPYVCHGILDKFEFGRILDYQCLVAEASAVDKDSIIGKQIRNQVDVTRFARVQFLPL